MTVSIDEVVVADPSRAWESAGFTVVDGTCQVGSVQVRFDGSDERRGVTGWSLRGVPSDIGSVDGVPTQWSGRALGTGARHANGVTSIDHVVLASPNLRRTVEALGALDLRPRREREGELGGVPITQIFYRLGEVILEVVANPTATDDGPSSLWGLTFTVDDIDASAEFFGERASRVKDAVQPGRRITTLRHRELGMSVRIALMSPASN